MVKVETQLQVGPWTMRTDLLKQDSGLSGDGYGPCPLHGPMFPGNPRRELVVDCPHHPLDSKVKTGPGRNSG